MCTLGYRNVQRTNHGNRGLLFSYLNWPFHMTFPSKWIICIGYVGKCAFYWTQPMFSHLRNCAIKFLSVFLLPHQEVGNKPYFFQIHPIQDSFFIFIPLNWDYYMHVPVCLCISSSLCTLFSFISIWKYSFSLLLYWRNAESWLAHIYNLLNTNI